MRMLSFATTVEFGFTCNSSSSLFIAIGGLLEEDVRVVTGINGGVLISNNNNKLKMIRKTMKTRIA